MLPGLLAAGPVELRRWRPSHLEPLMEAVAASLPELRRWMAWAQTMPSEAEQLDVLRAGEAAFGAGAEWNFLLFTPGAETVLGGAGLHPRAGPESIEVGYWVRSDRTGLGYATADKRAMGPVLVRMAKEGVITKTGQFRPARSSHGSAKAVWARSR